jgi:lipopolysaccharide/colanic/teichoic acid biosynthesis glycosyltransferase
MSYLRYLCLFGLSLPSVVCRRDHVLLTIRETGNIWYTRRRKTKQKHNTICVRHRYAQRNKNKVNITWPSHKQLDNTSTAILAGGAATWCHCIEYE